MASSLGAWLGGCQERSNYPWFRSDIWDPFGLGIQCDETSAIANAHIDWRETDNAHIFSADLPGVRKEEVKVNEEDENILQISGEGIKEHEDKIDDDKWHRVERQLSSFVRRFWLRENSNFNEIKGSLENGVLTMIVPKKKVE